MYKWIVSIAVVCAAFVWGFSSGYLHIFPYEPLRSAFRLMTGEPSATALPPAQLAPVNAGEGPAFPPVASHFPASCTPASAPIAVKFGNNHDVVYLPGTPGSAYAHYLLIAGEVGTGQLYGTNTLSPEPDAWTLLVDDYHVIENYELDDAIVIDNTYYIFESHEIFAYKGDPAEGSGKWKAVARFPDYIDDVGVYFDGEKVHVFGEYAHFSDRPDGTSIGYVTAPPDFSEWTLVNSAIANPNVYGDITWGVGDASIIEVAGRVLMTTDIESDEMPYRIALWDSEAFGRVFDFAGIIAEPEPGTEGLYNYHVQDGDLVPASDGTVLMFGNWRDIDGNPGKDLPAFEDGKTRVIGGYTCRFG